MMSLKAVVFWTLVSASCGADDLAFPPWFKFGAGSSAYQVEGAWNVSDKGESVLDRLMQTHPEFSKDGSNGDVACDSYHQWQRDVQMVKELGLDFYRFSISWSRLLPTGFSNRISEDGKKYYSNLIDALLQSGVEPSVTLYHFDLPQKLQNLGGWTNPLASDWFADYARVAFSLYGDRVRTWFTINEPTIVCTCLATCNNLTTEILELDNAEHMCMKHVLIAHAKAWKIYDNEFKPKYHGQVSIVESLVWYEEASPDDEEITELIREDTIGRFAHPIYSKEGGWPPATEQIIAENSKKRGYPRSRLPAFTREEIELIRGSSDFYGINYYLTTLVRKAQIGKKVDGHCFSYDASELGAVIYTNPEWDYGFDNFSNNTEGLRKLVSWLKNKYGDQEFLIVENGYASSGNNLNDEERVDYLKGVLKVVLRIIKEDKINITGYSVWSLQDDFELINGYRYKFGLYEVDFSSPLRTRTPRKSAQYYRSLTTSRSLNVADSQSEIGSGVTFASPTTDSFNAFTTSSNLFAHISFFLQDLYCNILNYFFCDVI